MLRCRQRFRHDPSTRRGTSERHHYFVHAGILPKFITHGLDRVTPREYITRMDALPIFTELVERAGGLKRLTDALGEEKVQTVSNWRHRGIPANRCKLIESLYGISVKRLRPDDWQMYWPEEQAA